MSGSIVQQDDTLPATSGSAVSMLCYNGLTHVLQWVAISMFALAVVQRPAASDVATNNPTNYNVVTTLLGTLTSAVNAANANQNDIGVKVNVLLAIARERGDIASS